MPIHSHCQIDTILKVVIYFRYKDSYEYLQDMFNININSIIYIHLNILSRTLIYVQII